MARVLQALAPASLMLAMLTLAGCPPQPKLSVTPLAIAIGAQEAGSEFQITNTGGGTLNWTVTENLAWLDIQASPANGLKQDSSTIQGTVTTDVNGVELIVDRSALTPGTTSGDIQVTSNGGTQNVRVTVTQAGEAALAVSSENLNFGTTQEQATFNVLNTGNEPLTWTIAVAEDAPWLDVTPSGGTIAGGGLPTTVTVSVDRSDLAANTFTGVITVSSNAGVKTVTASMIVAPFAVTPTSLNYGALLQSSSRNLTLRNRGFAALPLTITPATTSGGAWLSAASASLTLGSQASTAVSITANPSGLAPGDYSGTITVGQDPGGFSAVIPVTMSVSSFTVSNSLFELGTISATQTRTITLASTTGTPVNWASEIPVADQAWLSLSPIGGTVSTTQNVTLTVDPLAVDPGNYSSTFNFTYPGGSTPVTVTFGRPQPASLQVAPAQVQLGTAKNEELIGIWNPGIGTVDWSIDTTGFPAWLSLAPAAGGIASGSVSGETTDAVTLTVDRSQAPSGVFDLTFTFNVVGTGAVSTTVPVTVSATVPQIPVLVVETEGVGANNVNFINLDIDQDSETLVIRNEGNGVLTWNFDPTNLPPWIASIQPAQGNLAPGVEQTVTVTVNRETLTYLGAQVTLSLISNDPDRNPFPVVVEVLVEKRVAITARPSSLAFGPTQTSDIIEIANNGDPETLLNFQITSTKEWLSVFPDTGSSIGTASATKDFRPFSVTVDRSLLEGNGASGRLIVTAFNTENGERVPVEGVVPFEIEVTAQAAELTIETTPIPYLRPPSIVRFPMLLRNVRYQALPLDLAFLPQVASQTTILENDVQLELTETAQIMRSMSTEAGSGGDRGVRQTVLIMLDYSGSMQESASSVDDPAISGALDPIQALYERVIPPLLDSLGPETRVGLAIFNERNDAPLRALLGTFAEPAEQQDQVYIYDRAALLARLQSVVVNDNGATQLFGAIFGGIESLLLDGFDNDRFGLDFTDFPSLVCFTDGRITTPPSPINDVIQTLQSFRIRFYPVGWGTSVASDPLVRLSVNSGGHYYSTRTQPTGEVDAFGTPLRKAVVSELENLTTSDADECDQSIAKDFNSLVTLSYITLNEQSNATIQTKINFDDPNDQDSACLPEQGLINGSFTSLAVAPDDYVGDNRMGQISMRSSGIRPDGSATVTLRLEFVPRNVSRLSVRLRVDAPDSLDAGDVVQTSSPDGGVISNWTASVVGDVFTYTSPAGPLTYGQYGDILTINLSNLGTGALLRLDVLDPVISGNAESKYFIAADTIPLVESLQTFAPALPAAAISTVPVAEFSNPRSVLDYAEIELGTSIDLVNFEIRNIGGSFESNFLTLPTGLEWNLNRGGIGASLIALEPPFEDEGGQLFKTEERSPLVYRVDRSTEPDTYEATLELSYDFISIPLSQTMPRYTIRWTVLPPVLTVSETDLDFGDTETVLSFAVSNTGQSSLTWSINEATLPPWLTVDIPVGTQTYVDPATIVQATVDRTGLAPGQQGPFTLVVRNIDNPAEFRNIVVLMNVPAP